MVRDVFISHAHKDGEIAGAICQKLESAGVKCWIVPRDIAAGEDWTKAIRNAIEASRVMVLVFSENTNVAPHIEREIANAFYVGRIIIPFRLTKALPGRDLLFYLGDAQWFDAPGPSIEQDLDALAARIKGLLVSLPAHSNDLALQGPIKRAALNLVNSGEGGSEIARYRLPRIFKRAAIAASVAAAVWLLWLASQQMKRDLSLDGSSLQSTYNGARTSSTKGEGDTVESTPRYTFTRLGLWVAAKTTPTPLAQPEPQNTPVSADQPVNAASPPPTNADQNGSTEKEAVHDDAGAKPAPDKAARTVNRGERHRGRSRPKVYNRKASGGSKSWSVKGWLTGLLHEGVERIKETWNH
jgi:hypothetical protein